MYCKRETADCVAGGRRCHHPSEGHTCGKFERVLMTMIVRGPTIDVLFIKYTEAKSQLQHEQGVS